jgi:hypothetical protein
LSVLTLVAGRTDGTNVCYRVVDPQIFAILALARDILASRMSELQSMVDEERLPAPPDDFSSPGNVAHADAAPREERGT